jgi:RNA polymerase subunit RPABC4/transcription elongation factor Spt4
MHLKICKNCEHTFQGNFCPNCGQKAETSEIDLHFIVHEVPHSAFHINKGIFYTIKELSLRPGKTIRAFIAGKRIYHFPPLTYVILMSTIYLLIKGLQVHFGFDELKHSQEFVRKHQLAFFISIIPSYALIYWFFHLKFGYNYWKYLVSQTFITGHLIFILILPNALFFVFPKIRLATKDFFTVAAFGYYIYAYYQIHNFKAQSKLKLLIRELFCFLIASIFSLGITVVVFGLIQNHFKK